MMMRNDFKSLIYLIIVACFSSAKAGSYEDFFAAITRNNGSTIAGLLERGFDPNSVDPGGRTPLALALQINSQDAAEALWRHPQLKVDQANASGETALMMAALHGHDGWAKRLVERGAAVNRAGWTPLHYAASGPSTALVAWLLDQGALPDARAPNGTTALMMAAGYGPQATVELLRTRGATVNIANDAGLDAAAFARKAGREALAQSLSARR